MKRERQQGGQQGSSACLSVGKAALHPATGVSRPDQLLHLRMMRPREQTESTCAAGTVAASCALTGGVRQGGTAACDYECASVRSPNLSQGAVCESQPASICALNHDSVCADGLKDKRFRCKSKTASQNSLL